jgi:thiosulfate dehydrogenase
MDADNIPSPKPPSNPPQMRGMSLIIIVCCAAGIITISGSIAWGRGWLGSSGGTASGIATEEYGKRLIAQTTLYLGPDVADPKMRYTNSRLACASCHAGAGAEPGSLGLATAIVRYPQISPRTGQKETVEARINDCMKRNMNGRALPTDSTEMVAMVSYLRFLADKDAATGVSLKQSHDGPMFSQPTRDPDLESGGRVFEKRCAACHGKDGAGLLASLNRADGYLFPPVWGKNSFAEAAGMHRVPIAAAFIKAKMPVGKPDLSDSEAFDVAGYINSKPRPPAAK